MCQINEKRGKLMKQSGVDRINRMFIFSVALMFIFSFVSAASATNGYFAHGYSVKNKALAGAGTALPLDSLAASNNPAGMVFVGQRADVGISFFNPNRQYTVTGAAPSTPGSLALGTVESNSDWFIIPSLGANWMLNKDSSAGVSIYGNGGMNTDYDTATYAGGTSPTGVDLAQLFVVPSYALKVHPKHSFGIGVIGAYQTFEAQGLEGFAGVSQDPDNLTNNGHDNSYGYGARVGYLGEVLPGLFFGASYQTKIYMSKFDDYAGLFAEDGDFDIPANWSAGLAYEPVPELTFVFDVQQIFYSDVDSVGNDFSGFNTCYGTVVATGSAGNSEQCLGGDDGIGFGWNDMTVYKFGIQWQSSPDWTWRAGYSYGEQPIPDSEVLFNIVAPGVIEEHITGGLSKTIGGNQEFNFALMYALENAVSGSNPQDPSQTIELQMNQWEITVGYSWMF
jgi:long-chain fatty acid transport protein